MKVKEETSRIEPELNQEKNYSIPLLIGAGILMIYFALFAFNTFDTPINNELYFLFYGEYNDQYVVMKGLVLVVFSFILLVIGLPVFMKGLGIMRKTRKEKQDRILVIFNITFVCIMIATVLVTILDAISNYYVIYKGPHPVFSSSTFVSLIKYSSLVLFPLVIILVGIQSYLLRKRELYTRAKIKRQIVPYIMMSSLVVWVICAIIYHSYGPGAEFIVALSGYTSSQLSTSLLAAGIYLELIIKIDNSAQEEMQRE